MMDWKAVVNTVAPWIATAVTGPLGGMAVTAIADALGVSDKTEEAIKQAIVGATPEQMLALKKADQEFAIKMRELGFAEIKDMEALAVQDRDSARKREMTVQDKTPRNLAYAVTAGFFSVLAFMLTSDVPDGSRDVLNIMLGSLGTAWISIISYYYGSSSGSRLKTELIAKAPAINDEKK